MVGFNKKTVKDINLTGKRVLLRADYNVPIVDNRVADDYRIRKSLPTIKYILEQKPDCLIIISHLGRPEGRPDPELSLQPVAKKLSQLLDDQVGFGLDCIGQQAQSAVAKGGVLLLENLRFHAGEEKDDPAFAKKIVLSTGAQIFVQDGFGVVHRAHASTDAITKLLPSVAGLLLEAEVVTIRQALAEPQRPFIAIVGGAKISDKIEVLAKFIKNCDAVAVVGALANNFLAVEDIHIGKSLVERGLRDETEAILELAKSEANRRAFNFLVPVDAVVARSVDGRLPTRLVDLSSNSLADIEAYPKKPLLKSHSVAADELVLDIGPISAAQIAGAIKMSRTAIWAGTAGVTETKGLAGAQPPFGHGSRIIAEALIGESLVHKNKPFTIVGGGDTVSYVEAEGLVDDFNHVSTGGSASLDLMAGKKLPGLEVLEDKN